MADSDKDILRESRKNLAVCVEEQSTERAAMMDDLRFCTLDQWPAEIRMERENDVENGPRPCLTIDKINQYIVQVVNDMRQGRPGIMVRPQDDKSDIETAKIIKGVIRNIEDQSSADIAYAMAAESAAKIGVGYFRITTEYVDEESSDQDIFIRPIANTFAVYMSRHMMPDGSDAERCYIVEQMPLETFKRLFPKAKYEKEAFDDLGTEIGYWWSSEKTITVAEEFCFEYEPQTLYYLADGTTMTKADYDAWPEEAGPRQEKTGERLSFKKKLKWRKLTGAEILEKRDLPGKYIPVVEVIGRESTIDGRRVLWGLVRPAKDSLRMYNYWASTITEKMALAPKNPFIGAKGQFEGQEDRWRDANRKNRAYLEYNAIDVNGNAIPAPQRQGATPMEAAYFNFMQVIEHDVQTSLGMFKAAVGETESQQSGRAILALQKESDTGTYHFGANLGISIRHAGRVILDLIPHYYDTKRVVRIIGDDGEVKTAQIDPQQEESHRQITGADGAIKSIYNPTVGKYDVTITVGPSYNTKRMEAAATFVEMAKGSADPASAAVLRYLVMRNSDSAGADEAAKLLKTLLPPQALQAMDSKEAIPPKVQAMMQQMQMQGQQMAEQMKELQAENVQLKAGVQEAQIKAEAQKQIAAFEAQSEERNAAMQARLESAAEQMRQQAEAIEAERQRQFEAREAERERQFKEWEARLEARVDIETANIDAETKERVAARQAAAQAAAQAARPSATN